MSRKPLSEMTADELRDLSKALSVEIKALQDRRAEVQEAFAMRQEEEKALAAVRALGPAKRAALLRVLESQAREDADAAAKDRAALAAVADAAEADERAAADAAKLEAVRAADAARLAEAQAEKAKKAAQAKIESKS